MSKKDARKRIDNNLLQLAAGIKVSAELGTGGSDLSNYGTIAYSNNYALMTLNRIILTYLYTGNGIFQTAIQLPVQDAISKGVEIESDELDNSDIDDVLDYWEEHGIWDTILDAATWARLYGGGAVLINTAQDPESKLSLKGLDNSPIEFYDIDRWQLDNAGISGSDYFYPNEEVEQEYYYLHGEKIHRSRMMVINGKKAPSYVRRQLRGWGMSEGERMIRDLNNYLKTQDVLYEILDESKIDVYHIKGLANKLLTTGGTTKIQNRVQAANEIKNYVNALVLDAEEEYEQKQASFTGLAETMQQNRIGVASALRMPMTKLFGLSASGFNTGESDLENYIEMVDSDVRARIRPIVRNMMRVTMSHLFGYEPTFRFTWPSLRVLSAEQEQQVKDSQTNRAIMLYDRGIVDSHEVGEMLAKDGVLTIETKAEQGIIEPQPQPPEPATGQEMSPQQEQRDLTVRRNSKSARSYRNAIKVRRSKRNDEGFKEEKIERDDGGKFAPKGGGGTGGGEGPQSAPDSLPEFEKAIKEKYGTDEMPWSEMTDKEMSQHEELEREFYKKGDDDGGGDGGGGEESGDDSVGISAPISDERIEVIDGSMAARFNPINPVSRDKVEAIKASLLQEGWSPDEPLFVFGDPGQRELLTGSHRVTAVKELEDQGVAVDVPIVDVSEEVEEWARENPSQDIPYDSLSDIFKGTDMEKYKDKLEEW